MFHGLLYACGAYACDGFLGFFLLWGNFLIVQYQEAWLGAGFRCFAKPIPLSRLFLDDSRLAGDA
jgi:hypothetical protein